MIKAQAMNGKSKKLVRSFETYVTYLKIRCAYFSILVHLCVYKGQNEKYNE